MLLMIIFVIVTIIIVGTLGKISYDLYKDAHSTQTLDTMKRMDEELQKAINDKLTIQRYDIDIISNTISNMSNKLNEYVDIIEDMRTEQIIQKIRYNKLRDDFRKETQLILIEELRKIHEREDEQNKNINISIDSDGNTDQS